MTSSFTLIRLAPEFLQDSPTNPRQFYDEAALQELAESIKSQGLIQPIVARPIGNRLVNEIVCGHRRVRAARLAGHEVIEALVRDMTDEEAAAAQIHENLARKDVTPLEEAEGFDRLMRVWKVAVAKIIETTGKSKGYIYGILSLRKLFKPGKEALATGLPVDLAQRVATLPTEAIQRKALDDLRAHEWVDGVRKANGWVSVREGKRILSDRSYFMPIASAPFDLAATYGDMPACATCERRSTNDPADTSGQDVCADVPCYEKKLDASRQARAQALRDQGHRVLEGDEAREFKPTTWEDPKGYCPLELEVEACDELVEVAALLEMRPDTVPPPSLTYILQPNGTLQGYIKTADLNSIGHAIDAAFESEYDDAEEAEEGDGSSTASTPSGEPATPAHPQLVRAASPASCTPEEEAARDHWDDRILPALMRKATTTERTTDEMRLVAAVLIDYATSRYLPPIAEQLGLGDEAARLRADGNHGDVERWLKAQLPELAADTLGLLVVLLALADEVPGIGRSMYAGRVALANRFGVDTLAAAAEPQAQLEGLPPADKEEEEATPAAKPAARGGKNPPVKYRNPATSETWSGRGLQPKWLKAAIAAGNKLADFAVEGATA